MNPKIIAFILPCLIGVPMLVFNLGMIGTWASHEEAMGQTPSAPAAIAGVGKFISSAWFAHNDRSEREDVFDPTALTINRTVKFSRPITIADVLKPGEPEPRPEFHHLFILARAPAFAMDECPNLLQELATSCAIGQTSVEAPKDGGYRLNTHYVYLPEQEMGDTSQINRANLSHENVDFTPSRSGGHVAKADLAALRLETYRSAMLACEELRLKTGTCALTRVSFSQTEVDDRLGFYDVGASARLAWLKVGFDTDDVDLNEKGLADRISGFFSTAPREEPAQAANAKPTPANGGPAVLNGGTAFRSAGAARFAKAKTE